MPYPTTLWLPDGNGRVRVEQLPDNVRPIEPAPAGTAEERSFAPGAERIGPFPVALKSG